MPEPKPQPVAERPTAGHAERHAERPAPTRSTFRRPVVRRLGALPAVTTAFGGSFSP
ncbi:MAG: hypothetical protein H6735_14525 [Alphaproteobacteria bacterium]|nr:hypothetical protein [Alphaproteobacteria bacterium]